MVQHIEAQQKPLNFFEFVEGNIVVSFNAASCRNRDASYFNDKNLKKARNSVKCTEIG